MASVISRLITQNIDMMRTNQNQLSTFKIAAAYIGTVVGAGFASGQEVLQFFGYFGLRGVIGLIFATALFIVFGYSILKLGYDVNAESHLPVVREAGGRFLGTVIDWVITFFLFGALVVMAAGTGAIFGQEFNLSPLLGSLVMVIASLVTVLLGFGGVISAISYVVPVLLTAVLVLAAYTLFSNPQALLANLDWFQADRAAVRFWPLAALLYISYNLVLAVAILAPLGASSKPGPLRWGAVWGGMGLGLGAMAITLALIVGAPAVARYEVPMLYLAGKVSPLFRNFYVATLLAEIYTTAVGSLYGFAARVVKTESPVFRWLAIGTGIAAFVAAQLGFSTLVGTLFPAVGYAGLLLLGALTYGMLKGRVAQAIYHDDLVQPALRKPGAKKEGYPGPRPEEKDSDMEE